MAAVTDPLYAIDPTSPAATGPAPGPAQPTPPLVLPSAAARTPAPAPAPSPSPGGFWRLLFAGPRALLLMPIRPGTVRPGAGSCILLVLLITLIGVAGEYWMLSPDDLTFNWASLRAAWFDLPILLLGGAWLAQPRMAPLHFAAVMLSASAWIVALAYGLFVAHTMGWIPVVAGDEFGTWIYLAAPLWSFLVATRTISGMNRHVPIAAIRRIIVLLALAATSAWYLLDPIEPYWLAPAPPEAEVYVDGGGAGAATPVVHGPVPA